MEKKACRFFVSQVLVQIPLVLLLMKEVNPMEKETMSVQELSSQMSISLPKAYELVKKKDFPVIHIGTRILIPVDAFKKWLVIHW